jgi:ubiquinone/menaquinone biosynthesis C-methylase UbiE
MTWTRGYISDVSYPAFFYKEMQPLWLSTVATLRGFVAPDVDGRFSLCELGCGVGINLLVAAACHPDASFVGVDFNADHLRVARDAAASAGIGNIEFVEADFATFARDDRRSYDAITCHGAWSWIAAADRAALLDHVSRSLKPSGLFYLHYMCHPGSTEMAPLQKLLNLCAHHMPGPSPRKAQVGMALLHQMAQGGVFDAKPEMARHLANMARRDPADLAHEFLTDHWQPQHSVDVHQQCAAAGLCHIGSADVFNNLDIGLSIPGKLQPLVRQTQLPALAEAIKDMARNAHQRMDLFQKAPVALDQDGFLERALAIRFRLLPHAPVQGPLSFETPIGPIVGEASIFTPLLQRLAAGPASGAELAQLPVFAHDLGGMLQSLQLLMMQGMAHPVGPITGDNDAVVAALSRWFDRAGIALTVLPQGATAISPAPACNRS